MDNLYTVSGDSLSWVYSNSNYPSGDGWTLKVYLSSKGETPTTITATPNVDGSYTFSAAPTVTSQWGPGVYTGVFRATKGSEVRTLESTTLVVDPDPSKAYDRRSHAAKCLAAIEAVIEGRMDDSMVSYEIDGVKAEHLPHDKLIKLRTHYAAVVRREQGGSPFKSIRVGLTSQNPNPIRDKRGM